MMLLFLFFVLCVCYIILLLAPEQKNGKEVYSKKKPNTVFGLIYCFLGMNTGTQFSYIYKNSFIYLFKPCYQSVNEGLPILSW